MQKLIHIVHHCQKAYNALGTLLTAKNFLCKYPKHYSYAESCKWFKQTQVTTEQ